MPLRLFYQNIAKGAVLPQVLQQVDRLDADLLLVTEPPKYIPSRDLSHQETFHIEGVSRPILKYHTSDQRTAVLLLQNHLGTPLLSSNRNFKSIRINKYNLRIYVVYCPSRDKRTQRKFRRILSPSARRTIVCVDSNTHSAYLGDSGVTCPGDRLIAHLTKNNWTLLNVPGIKTHFPLNGSSPSAIDWAICTQDISYYTRLLVIDSPFSDHSLLSVTFTPPNEMDNSVRRLNVIVKSSRFSNYMARSSFSPESSHDTINSAITFSITPKKTPKPPYWNETLAEAELLIKQLRRRPPRTPAIRKDRSRLIRAFLSLKRYYEKQHDKSLLRTMTLSQFDAHLLQVNRLANLSLPSILDDEGKRISDPLTVANLILRHFYPLGESITDYGSYRRHVVSPPLFTLIETRSAVARLRNTSPGEDKLNTSVIRYWFTRHPLQLLSLLNYWLESNSFPTEYRSSILTVIPKDHTKPFDLSNMRPIALSCCLGKCYETALLTRLIFYTVSSIETFQYAYVPGRSNTSFLIHLDRIRQTNLQLEKTEVVVSLDISGAFNNVLHVSILDTLVSRSCPQYIINIISHYLENRFIKITFDHVSASRLMAKGVPQGSVIGPYLFILALDSAIKLFLPSVSSLPPHAGLDVLLFADDVTLVFNFDKDAPSSLISSVIQTSIDQLVACLSTIGLSLNHSKTKYLMARCPSPCADLLLGAPVSQLSILGLLIDQHHTYLPHVEASCSTALRKLSELSSYLRTHSSLPTSTRTQLLYTRIFPLVTFASSVWLRPSHTEYPKIIRHLSSTHAKLIRLLFTTYPSVPYYATLLFTKQLPLHLLATRHSLVEAARTTGFFPPLGAHLDDRGDRTPLCHPSLALSYPWMPLTQMSPDVLSSYNYHFYTDGSRTRTRATAAFQIYRPSESTPLTSRVFDLPLHSSSYQCEAVALLLALRHTGDSISDSSLLFITDSTSLLNAISSSSFSLASSSLLLRTIGRLLIESASRNNRHSFAWIRSRTGHNLQVDALCKQPSSVSFKTPVTSRFVTSHITQQLWALLEEEYSSATKSVLFSSFFPTVNSAADPWVFFDRSTIQIYTGHGPFMSYTRKIHPHITNKCHCDFALVQDPPHTLFHCPSTRHLALDVLSKMAFTGSVESHLDSLLFLSSRHAHVLVSRIACRLVTLLHRNSIIPLNSCTREHNYFYIPHSQKKRKFIDTAAPPSEEASEFSDEDQDAPSQ